MRSGQADRDILVSTVASLRGHFCLDRKELADLMLAVAGQVTTSPPIAVVADDDGQMRSLVAAVLGQAGFTVVELGDGAALVEYLRSSACPALLVTDLQMPGFTGLQAIRYVRRLGLEMPVILVTAFGNPRIHIEGIRLGATAVLDKPFTLGALRALATSFFAASEEPSGVRGDRPGSERDAG